MKKEYTHFVFVLDRSGSMAQDIKETLQGIEGFINKNKIPGKQCTYSLYSFSDELLTHSTFSNINDYKTPLIEADGMTALFDSFVISIDKTGESLAQMQEKDRPEKVIVVTLTDGGENSSKNFKSNHVKSRIEEQKNKYGWEFIFLGADFSIDSYAQDFGLTKGTSRNISKAQIAYDLSSVGASVSLYRSAGYSSGVLHESLEKIGD